MSVYELYSNNFEIKILIIILNILATLQFNIDKEKYFTVEQFY